MTQEERAALNALQRVSFGMSSARIFVRNVGVKPDDYALSDRQRWNLVRLAWRYRRQLPRAVSDWALEVGAGGPCPDRQPADGKARPPRRSRARDAASEALRRPLKFGDVEQVQANRRLARIRRVL